jgi:hypothetical protein
MVHKTTEGAYMVVPKITNAAELESAVQQVSEVLQAITNYSLADKTHAPRKKITFPRQFVGTKSSYTKQFDWLLNDALKRNLAYELIFVDVLRWLSNHTDIYGPARQMLYKHVIVIFGAILESLLNGFFVQNSLIERRVPAQFRRLLKEKVIAQKLYDELEWMWELRQSVHLFLLNQPEIEKYSVSDVKRALAALASVQEALADYMGALETPF